MKKIKLLLFALLIFTFSCGDSDIKKSTDPVEIKYVVELLNCDGTVSETIEATNVIYYSSGETRITLLNGGKIDYKGRLKSTKQFSDED